MSHGNIILDIHRWEKFEFGYDGWLLVEGLDDWRTLAQLSIDSILNNNDTFNDVIELIRSKNPHLAPESAVQSFKKWIISGGKRSHGNITFRKFNFEIYYGYVFPFDLEYDLAEYFSVKLDKIPKIDSFWMPHSE